MPKRERSGGGPNLASCAVAALFILFLVIVALIVFFTVFKPREPRVSVNAVQLPSFSISNNSVSFTLSQYVAVANPNRAAFSHYDSTLQLFYSGSQIGFMFIPAGQIASGHTQYMAATFAVQSFPLSTFPDSAPIVIGPTIPGAPPKARSSPEARSDGNSSFSHLNRVAPTMQIESRIHLGGRVRVLYFFTHHVETHTVCRVAIALGDGSVLGFRC